MLARVQDVLLRGLADDRLLSLATLEKVVAYSLGDLRLGLCLHRVGFPSVPGNAEDDMNIASEKLDALLELLVAQREKSRWLSVTFDDGYADAARYMRTRARRFPSVEFIFFVCPAKLVERTGFRWDLPAGTIAADPFGPPFDSESEAHRPELAGLADRESTRLATAEECIELRRDHGVMLGNHSNQHLQFSSFGDEAARREIDESRRQFESLFGPTAHFAFPFGTVGQSFGPRDADFVFDAGYDFAWSTEPRPYSSTERHPGHVLPRIGVFGTQSLRSLAALVAVRALRFRMSRRTVR